MSSSSLALPSSLLLIRQPVQQVDTQNHYQQSNRDDDEQRESKPTQHHRTGTDATSHTAVSEILRDLSGCHRRCVLP